MNYFDMYQNRIRANGGTVGESFKRSTVDVVNKMFPNSPLYKQILIDGVLTEVRVVTGKLSNVKTLLLRPDKEQAKGSLALIDSVNWLTIDFETNQIYPKAMIQKCNEHIKWKDKVGVVHDIPCVLTNTASLFSFGLEQSNLITVPNGELGAFVKYQNETKTIQEGQRFIFGSRSYKVTGFDDITDTFNGVGLLKVSMKLDIKQSGDDFTNDIADNSALYAETTQNSGGVSKW